MSEPVAAIRTHALAKRYGALEAVRGIDLEVRTGEIFGLIGPDGAGKTSTFQILGGVMEATSGEAELLGQSAREARAHVGYLTQAFSLYPDLSAAENLRYVGDLRRVPVHDIEQRGRRYLAMFGMERFTDRLAGRLSGGMKQKLALACALVAEPAVLLLDEPTTGVDPVSRREFWDALAQLSSHGMTILLATPYLDEAERCHRVALMHDGLLHRTGTPLELRQSLGLERLEVRASDLRRAEAALAARDGIVDVQRFGDRLDVLVRDAQAGERAVREALGPAVESVRAASPTLENTFVAILRSLEGDGRVPPFPDRRPHEPAADSVAIGARALRKTYGEFTAVKGIDLEIRYGEVYGLLGANGAGKTTTIKMLCGLVEPSDGEVRLAGEVGELRSPDVRQQVGYMSQKFSLYDDLTINENLDFFSGVYGVPPARRAARKEWVLEFAGLRDQGGQLTGSLPGGWKQRVAFGAAIMHEPRVLFLDEPTSGVDPIARRAFWAMINQLADQGTAILVTTHYLEEAEQCNRLGFMVSGELVAEGTPSGVKAAQGGRVLEIQADDPLRAVSVLKTEMEPWRVSLFGDRFHVIVDGDPQAAARDLTARLAREDIRVREARDQDYSLEDVFLVIAERGGVAA
ncbi:MAG TPA: ATP-binding cassette domain-containing protein [Methylomirabilota bacterium]|nr:ATP-binding cassette domain-containing protein [Methylomirabilota bacterium]